MRKVDVVLLARVNDPVVLATTAQFTTVVSVYVDETDSESDAVEYALGIADPVSKWSKY